MKTEDGSIISKCLNGDHDAFGLLVDKYKDGVYALAYSRLHNTHNAEDVSQEVFIKVYEKLHTLRRWDRFAGWLYRMTIRLCINYLEVQSIRPDREHIEDNSPEIFDNQTMDSYHAESKFNELHESLDSLSEEHREVIMLHYFSGMTSFEISKFVGVSPDAIRRRLMRARSMLKEEILSTISIAFDEQKLHAGFTPRILEMTKHTRIHPIPKEIIIPWGASLTGAIIVAILTMSAGLMIVRSYYDVSVTSESSGVIGPGQVPVYVTDKAEIESGGGTVMLSGKKIGAFVTVMAALAVLSNGVTTENAVAQTQWTKEANPVINSYGYEPCVLKIGNEYKMWYNDDSCIHYTTSVDGITWGNDQIVLRPGGNGGWDDIAIFYPSVLFDGTKYKMWYGNYVPITEIGYATSDDGIHWEKYTGNPVLNRGEAGTWDSMYITAPSVLHIGNKYKMWYSGYSAIINPHDYQIGYAISDDGIHWEKYADNPVVRLGTSGTWDEHCVSNASVLFDGNEYKMWYSGSKTNYDFKIGYATSADGIIWIKYSNNPVLDLGPSGSWESNQVWCPTVILDGNDGNIYKMWYVGGDGSYPYPHKIGYATSIIPTVTTQINIDPNTLNLKSGGNWVTCYIQPPDGFGAEDIDVSSIKLQGTLTVEKSDIQNSVLMVKFNRDKLITYIKGLNLPLPTDVSLEVTGKLTSGLAFIGSDTIKVINPSNEKKSLAEASEFTLLSAYPQPFNPEVWIPYKLGDSVQVKFSIYNANGSLVRTLNLGYKPEGSYISSDKAAYWDGRNESGEKVSSGIYFYNIQAGNFSATKKMIVKK